MRTSRFPQRRSPWLRSSLLALPVLWIACGSSVAPPDSLRVCYDYAAAMDRCLSGAGADAEAVSRQVDAIRKAIRERAADPVARAELKRSCTSAVERLQHSCPSPSPASASSM
jgi:hypothetical protein